MAGLWTVYEKKKLIYEVGKNVFKNPVGKIR